MGIKTVWVNLSCVYHGENHGFRLFGMPFWRHTYHHKVLSLSSCPLTIGECLHDYVRSKKKIVDRVQIFLMYFKKSFFTSTTFGMVSWFHFGTSVQVQGLGLMT